MPKPSSADSTAEHLQVGNRALLLLLGQRFLVGILEVTPAGVRVSFPVQNFPIEGMQVQLEFHDENGYTSCDMEVLESPKSIGDGLLLARTQSPFRTQHRTNWRVPAALAVSMREQAHPRPYEGHARNISAGGILVESDAALLVNDAVDLSFALPSGHRITTVAEVISVAASPERTSNAHLYGFRFLDLEPADAQALRQYIWHRLRELYPQQQLHLR